jgi:hypothetical protein
VLTEKFGSLDLRATVCDVYRKVSIGNLVTSNGLVDGLPEEEFTPRLVIPVLKGLSLWYAKMRPETGWVARYLR